MGGLAVFPFAAKPPMAPDVLEAPLGPVIPCAFSAPIIPSVLAAPIHPVIPRAFHVPFGCRLYRFDSIRSTS